MRVCLLQPPAEADQAASYLDVAADAILDGNMEAAAELLRKADIRTLHAYAARVMSPAPELLGFAKRSRPARTRLDVQRSTLRMPTGADAETVFRRDGYRCRYCDCRIVRPGVRSLLSALFPEVVLWPIGKGGDDLKHAAFFALNGVLDHVEPYSRGGDSSVDNVVTSCWPCNFGKEDYSIQELGLIDPRLRDPVLDDWDGLHRLTRHRLKPAKSPSQPQPRVSRSVPRDIDAWLTLLTSTTVHGVVEALQDLLDLLRDAEGVHLSVRRNLTVSIERSGRLLSIFGLDLEGNVDVPWLIDGEKRWFRPFAEAVANAIPDAVLYETPTMWRVDGCGSARGQITVDEFVGAATVIIEGVKRLAEQALDH